MKKYIGKFVGTTHKVCSKCEKVKLLSDFRKKGKSVRSHCRACTRQYDRSYNTLSLKRRKHRYAHHHEIIKYEEMLQAQGGVCAICKQLEKVKTKEGKTIALAVDHCHATGNTRGLLCQICNIRLATIEDQAYLEAALRYLEKYKI